MNEISKDSPEFEDMAKQIFEERATDFNGWFLESFTEADDKELSLLSLLIRQHRNQPLDKQHDLQREIGLSVIRMVEMACEPMDSEVVERLNLEGE